MKFTVEFDFNQETGVVRNININKEYIMNNDEPSIENLNKIISQYLMSTMYIHYVGETVDHKGHKCEVIDVWTDPEGRKGMTIEPIENYGFPIDIYDEQL